MRRGNGSLIRGGANVNYEEREENGSGESCMVSLYIATVKINEKTLSLNYVASKLASMSQFEECS